MFLPHSQDFDLKQTFGCGQCFRWNAEGDGYACVVGNCVIKARGIDGGIEIDCPDEDFVTAYFDLKRNYSRIKNAIKKDAVIQKALIGAGGIRLLKQDPWETLVSFIISANNNIPRIKKIIEALCCAFGKKIVSDGRVYYTFPEPGALAILDPSALYPARCGFRDKYIIDAARKVASGQIDLQSIRCMDADEGRSVLKQIAGVGDKVADCILLFAYQKFEVFPKDVWIKRIVGELYGVGDKGIDAFVREKFGVYGGFAQQYLFHYARG